MVFVSVFYLSHWFLVIPWVTIKMAIFPKKIFGEGIILTFSTIQLHKSNPTNTPEITENEVNNFRPIKKIEPKTNSSTKISNEETYDDSSKNLANFFNGEIIDLDE